MRPIHHHKKGRQGGPHHKHDRRHKKSSWFSEMFSKRSPRIGRGEIRYLILDVLTEQGRHGYEIMQMIEDKTSGGYRPSAGTIYPALQLAEDMELIVAKESGKRKIYELTDKGREELDSHRLFLDEFYEDVEQNATDDHDEFLEMIHDQITLLFRVLSRSIRRGELAPAKADEIKETISQAVEKVVETMKK